MYFRNKLIRSAALYTVKILFSLFFSLSLLLHPTLASSISPIYAVYLAKLTISYPLLMLATSQHPHSIYAILRHIVGIYAVGYCISRDNAGLQKLAWYTASETAVGR